MGLHAKNFIQCCALDFYMMGLFRNLETRVADEFNYYPMKWGDGSELKKSLKKSHDKAYFFVCDGITPIGAIAFFNIIKGVSADVGYFINHPTVTAEKNVSVRLLLFASEIAKRAFSVKELFATINDDYPITDKKMEDGGFVFYKNMQVDRIDWPPFKLKVYKKIL